MRAIARITCLVSLTALCVACGGGGSPQPARQTADNTSPVISLIGDNPQIIAVGDPYIELGATATDNVDGDLTTSIVVDASPVDDSVPGTYIVTYNVRDAAGNAADTVTRTVIYEDRRPPLIALVGDNPQILLLGTPYTELGATATDNVDGDLTTSIVIDASAVDPTVPGDYSVSYDVSDTAGNAAATVIRTVTYEDRTPPVITLAGSNPQVIQLGNPFIELGATAIDNVDGDLTTSIAIDASAVDTSVPGDYSVTYNVSDAAGNAATTVTRTVSVPLPVPPEPTVSVTGDIKQLIFSWTDVDFADFYRLLENPDGHTGFAQVGDDIPAGTLSVSRDIAVHLFDWVDAQYIVEACNTMGCRSSDTGTGTDVMLDTIGYFKASNAGDGDRFGEFVGLSADGATLAVGAMGETSDATGIDGDQSDSPVWGYGHGAAYVFRFDGSAWQQQAYIKASNTEARDFFGFSGALSADGNTLAIGAFGEDSNATGIDGDQADNSAEYAGAVYLFRFDGSAWYQQAYIKASNTDEADEFGGAIALSADGDTLAVGAAREASNATGIDGDQSDNSAGWGTGAVYLFRFDGSAWYQQAYIKASKTVPEGSFGSAVALAADGNTLAVSGATGVDGEQGDNSAPLSGAVYLFGFDGSAWSQQAYVKASNTAEGDSFGSTVVLSSDGNTLAVGAYRENSGATGIDGDQTDTSAESSGAVYLFRFDDSVWHQQAYIKASNTDAGDFFHLAALSADGDTLAVGAALEASSARGVDGDQNDNSATYAGAVYVFRFDGSAWYQKAYVKASNTDERDHFGSAALSADGDTLAVGAYQEDGNATGIDGDQSDNSASNAGAVYLY